MRGALGLVIPVPMRDCVRGSSTAQQHARERGGGRPCSRESRGPGHPFAAVRSPARSETPVVSLAISLVVSYVSGPGLHVRVRLCTVRRMADSVRLEVRVSPEWLERLDRVRGIASRSAYVKWCVEHQVGKALGSAGRSVEFDPRAVRRG
jgi:hypothetical protein